MSDRIEYCPESRPCRNCIVCLSLTPTSRQYITICNDDGIAASPPAAHFHANLTLSAVGGQSVSLHNCAVHMHRDICQPFPDLSRLSIKCCANTPQLLTSNCIILSDCKILQRCKAAYKTRHVHCLLLCKVQITELLAVSTVSFLSFTVFRHFVFSGQVLGSISN